MSENFKDELNCIADSYRSYIKRDIIDCFIALLKNNMTKQSRIGLKSGKISIEDIYNNISESYLDNLDAILIEEAHELENDITDVFVWLLEEVCKTHIFRGICIEYINDDVDNSRYISFSW
jgi:hypothetical protein